MELQFEPWVGDHIAGAKGIKGCLRTVPENFYVADVMDDDTLNRVEGIESATDSLDPQEIQRWWEAHGGK